MKKLHPPQEAHVQRLLKVLAAENSAADLSPCGCHEAGAPILMFDGSTQPAETIGVGDTVMGWDSTARRVTKLIRGRGRLFQITPIKGSPFRVSPEHLLSLVAMGVPNDKFPIDVPAKEFASWDKNARYHWKLFRAPVTCWPAKKLPMAPYHLGLMLGDGSCAACQTAIHGPEAEEWANEIARAHGDEVRKNVDPRSECPSFYFRGGGVSRALRLADCRNEKCGTKRIPLIYKTGDAAQRAQLLAGLMDTDGSYEGGCFDFISKSPALSADVAYLARSLGLAAYIKPCRKSSQNGTTGDYHRVCISGNCGILPCRLARKQAGQRRQLKRVTRTGFSIEQDAFESDFFGFTIEGDGRYLMGDFTVTHNCGKTICAAEVARLLERRLFVVAPLSTLPAWREELDERGVSAVVTNYEQLRSKKNGWAVKDRMGRWSWTLDPNTVIIFDEAQKLKTPDSIASRIAIASRPYTSLLLSGSLAESPVHMRASGYLLGLHDLRSFGRWAKERGCTVNQWGKLVFNDNEKILDQLHRDILPAHGSQMTFAEMKAFMPNNQVIFEAVDFGDKGAISHFYEEMEVELAALEELVESDRKGAEALTMQLRARQKVELLKIPLLAERAAALAAEGSSVIVFLTYAASIDALSERLGGIPIIDGRHGDREAVRQAFCKDQTHIIAVNVAAGGAGISLHGKRPRRTILTPDYNPISIAQALGRAPRVGGGDVVQFVLTARGTVEDGVTASLKQKLRNIALVNGAGLCVSPASDKIVSDLKTELCDNQPTMTNSSPAAGVAIPEKEHAQFSPSALASLERCPGWRSTGGTNPAAERGTMIHAALEKDELHTLEDEDQNQAMLCRDFIDGYLADHLPAQPEIDLREVRLTMQLGNSRESFGTCDRLIIFGREAALFDFKMGRLSVDDAETNPQGEAYATGVLQQYPQVENVTVHFLQPARDWVSFHTFTRADLPRMILRHSTIIARAEANNPAQYAPAPSLCEWCAQQATCPALASKALLLSTKFASGLPLPENPVVSTERPEDIPHLLRLAPLMEAWARGVRAAALQASLEDGLEIDGFRRYERSTGRAVNSVIGAYEAVKDVLSLDEFLTACGTVSVPDLEEVFAERARQDATKKRGKVGAARQDLENRLRDADVLKEPGTIFFLREKKA